MNPKALKVYVSFVKASYDVDLNETSKIPLLDFSTLNIYESDFIVKNEGSCTSALNNKNLSSLK